MIKTDNKTAGNGKGLTPFCCPPLYRDSLSGRLLPVAET